MSPLYGFARKKLNHKVTKTLKHKDMNLLKQFEICVLVSW
jgi:hypothetical protein